jgi:hypothetical protein
VRTKSAPVGPYDMVAPGWLLVVLDGAGEGREASVTCCA